VLGGNWADLLEFQTRRDGRVVDGGGLEKRIDRFVEFANSFVKSARGARYGSMIELRPVAS